MYDNGEEIKKKLIEVLKEHPEGLTIIDIAKILGFHRQTVSKYILVLEASGVIRKRIVGPAKLHYLNDKILKEGFKIE